MFACLQSDSAQRVDSLAFARICAVRKGKVCCQLRRVKSWHSFRKAENYSHTARIPHTRYKHNTQAIKQKTIHTHKHTHTRVVILWDFSAFISTIPSRHIGDCMKICSHFTHIHTHTVLCNFIHFELWHYYCILLVVCCLVPLSLVARQRRYCRVMSLCAYIHREIYIYI